MRNEMIKKLYGSYPILKRIDERNKGIITDNAVFKKVYADEFISTKNSTCCGDVLFVLNGCIKIERVNEEGKETKLFDLREGELCHEALSCLLNFKSLNILGTAVQDTSVCILSHKIVRNYILNDKEFLSYMYGDLYSRFNKIILNKEEKMHEPVENRLIKYLINKNSKIIYVTHKEIAVDIDSGREVVSRKLKKLENMGYVKLARGKIFIISELEGLLIK